MTKIQVEISGDSFRDGDRALSLEPLREIVAAERKCFRKSGDGPWTPLEIFEGGFHHLVATAGAPLLEIDGIQMHRSQGVEPFHGALAWARTVVRAGDTVLDTCGGLGYTAIQASRLGAARVRSTELSGAVVGLRNLNPWSRQEHGLPIELSREDAFAHLARLPAGSIDSAIHDPPRYSLAPELYTAAFYVRLHDALGPGGRVFHYTGAPYSKGHGRDFLGGVMERLEGAGFRVTPRPDLQGLVALKRGGR